MIVVLSLGVIIGIYSFFETRKIGITYLELKFEGLPKAFDNFQFLHITDLHLKGFGYLGKQLIEKINSLNPKLILMTGDFKWSKYTDNKKVIRITQKILNSINPECVFICIKGNHDKKGFVDELKKIDVIYLQNEHFRLCKDGDEIYVLGVSKSHPLKKNRGKTKLLKAKSGLDDNVFKILLAHTPDYMLIAKKEKIDLVLAGDTHGGQVRLPLIGPVMTKLKGPKKYSMGLVKEDNTVLYTNRGIGTRAIPIRLLCPPEIAFITLRKGV